MFFKKKRETKTLGELYKMAEEYGIDTNNSPDCRINGISCYFYENSDSVLSPGWKFSVTDYRGKTFEYYVGQEYCVICNKMQFNNFFNKKHEICKFCFKELKNQWNKKNGYSLKDYIDSTKVTVILSRK